MFDSHHYLFKPMTTVFNFVLNNITYNYVMFVLKLKEFS